MIRFRVGDIARVIYKYRVTSSKTKHIIREEVVANLKPFVDTEIIAKTPVVTGAAKNAVDVSIEFDQDVRTRIMVSADLSVAPHWEFIENGSPPHTIYPVSARSLKFQMGGRDIFAAAVNHPGSDARYIFRSAHKKLNEQKAKIAETIKRKLIALFAEK